MKSEEENERFFRLEMKIAYQERLLEQLNEVAVERGRLIDDLERRLSKLETLLRESLFEKPAHERPPHY